MEDLRYKMIMALNAADIGNPICEQAAEICAEIAEQYCAELHSAATAAQLIAAVGCSGPSAPPAVPVTVAVGLSEVARAVLVSLPVGTESSASTIFR